MPKPVDFLFDCAAPNAYLVHKVLPEITERTGIIFNYVPILLGGVQSYGEYASYYALQINACENGV